MTVSSEIEYQQALEELRRLGKAVLVARTYPEVREIESRQYALMRGVCSWVLSRPRSPGMMGDLRDREG